jgi:hypothetical protein
MRLSSELMRHFETTFLASDMGFTHSYCCNRFTEWGSCTATAATGSQNGVHAQLLLQQVHRIPLTQVYRLTMPPIGYTDLQHDPDNLTKQQEWQFYTVRYLSYHNLATANCDWVWVEITLLSHHRQKRVPSDNAQA